MIYSYSSLSCYLKCPQQFYRKYKAKDTLPYRSKEVSSGIEIHEAIETALKTRTPLPEPLTIYEETISCVRNRIDNARIEQTIFLDDKFNYAVIKPPKGFVAKLDVLLISNDGRRAVVCDWKSGKPYEDTLQHDCYALAVLKAFPAVEIVTGFNIYLNHGKVGTEVVHERCNLQAVEDKLARIVARIEADERWAPKPSPLCDWCGANKCGLYPKKDV
jgi:CRISPR/Cas system-associated exonuclease Cas4 (RecB family)